MAPPYDLIKTPVPLAPLERQTGAKVIDFLPWAFPPIGSIPIDVVDVQTVNFGTTATILILDSPYAQAVFRFFANESTAFAGYTDLRWTILVNGQGYWPYVNMRESRGLLSNPDPILIKLPQSTRVQVAVQNLSIANNWEAKTRLKGWVF